MIFFNRNKILTILFAIVFLAGFSFFPAKAGAVYEGAGILISQNLLSGLGASRIHSFTYTTTMPAGTGLKIQFSSNNITWYDSAGTVDAWSNLSLGTNVIDLSGLKISSRYFYYKILFISDGTDTAVLDSILLNYIDDNFTENIYNTSGTLTSTNLLTGQLVKKVTGFTYTATDIPVGTGASAQFSQDNVTWYNSSNVLNGSDTLLAGTNTISLLTLNWTGANFYYRILFTSDGTDTPVLDSIAVNFNQPETFYWVGGAGNWSDATNHWATSSGGSPSSDNLPTIFDAVIFDGAGVGNCTLDVNAVFASINVTTGYTGTLDFNGKTVTGAVGGNFTFNIGTGGKINMSSSTITVDGNFDWSASAGTITEGTSTLVMTGSSKTLKAPYNGSPLRRLAKLTIQTGSTVTVPNTVGVHVLSDLLTINGSLTYNGTSYLQAGWGLTQGANGSMSGTGILYVNNGTLSLANSAAIAPAVFNIWSSLTLPTGTYSPTSSFSIIHTIAADSTFAWSAGTYTFTSPISVSKINTGTLTISGTNNPILIFQNNVTVTQTTGTIAFTNNSTNPNQLTGTANQTINLLGKNMGKWIINKPTSGAISWASGDTITAGGNWTSAAALTVPAGVSMDLGDGSYSHSITGDVTLDCATFDMGNSTLTIGGSFDYEHVTTFARNGNSIVFTGSSKSITGNGTWSSYAGPITIATGASYTVVRDFMASGYPLGININGTLTILTGITVFCNSAVVAIGSTGVLTGAGHITFYGGGADFQVVAGGAMTIDNIEYYNRSGALLPPGTYKNVSFDGGVYAIPDTWTWTPIAGTYTFTGNVNYNSYAGSVLVINNTNNPNFIYQGNVTFTNAGTLTYTKGTGTITLSGANNQSINTLNRSIEAIIINKPSGTVTQASSLTADGFTFTSGTLNPAGYSITTANARNFIISDGSTITASGLAGATWTSTGNFSANGHAGSLLTLNPASMWTLNVAGTNLVNYANVAYSNASLGTAVTPRHTTNSGNNVNWNFDVTAPTTSDDYGSKNNVWQNANQTITLSPYDNDSGLAWTKYCIDTNDTCVVSSGIDYTVAVNFTTEGTNYFRYASQDNENNTQATVSKIVKIDKGAPSTGSISYVDGYLNSASATITYNTGTDNGSGLNNSTGKIQRATATLTSGTCGTFSSFTDLVTEYDGSYTDTSVETGNCYKYQYLISDNAGNPAAYTSANVTGIDTQDPTTTNDYGSKNDLWQNTNQTITLTPVDTGGSQLSWTRYCIDIDNTCDPLVGTNYTTPVVISTENTNYFRYASEDTAGNTQATVSKIVKIDKTAPTTVASAGDYTFNTWTNGNVAVSLICVDGAGSGCSTVLYCTDTVNTCTPNLVYTTPVVVSTENTSYFRYNSLDFMSNPETTKTQTIKIDTTAPAVLNVVSTVSNQIANFSWETSELSSAKIEYGLTNNYGEQTAEVDTNPMTTLHSISVNVLSCENYHFRIISKDAQLNQSISGDYVLQNSCSASGGNNSGGGNSSGPNTSTTPTPVVVAPALPGSIVEQIVQQITNLTDQIATSLSKAPRNDGKITYPPIAEAVPIEPQEVFRGGVIVSKTRLQEIAILPLPEEIKELALKFPKFSETLEKTGVAKIEDMPKLQIAKLVFPGLAEASGTSANLLLNDFTQKEIEQVPTNFVFARSGAGNIDLNTNVAISNLGVPIKTIITIQNKPLHLVVKPDIKAESVKGYVIFKSANSKSAFLNWIQKLSNTLTASLLSATAQPQLNLSQVDSEVTAIKDIVLQEFYYNDTNNDGVWEAEIQSPVVDGKYEIRTVIDNAKTLSMIMVVDPEGYIYRKVGNDEARISNALVSIYWLNPNSKQYEVWPAKNFQQQNPQTTDITGKYSFLVPVGNYYLKVESKDYLTYQSQEFVVKEGSGVHQNIELQTKNWILKMFTVERIMIGLVLILLAIILLVIIFKKKKI